VEARRRTYLLVGLAAAGAAGLVVATVAFTRTNTGSGEPPTQTAAVKPRPGAPKLLLDLGVRTDSEARALRAASSLYDAGRRPAAGRIFRRYHSLQAQVGAAFAAWPDDALAKLERLGREHPRDAFVQLHLGLARFWRGRQGPAQRAWRAAARDPDTASAVHASDLLHPRLPPGLPEFVPSFSFPKSLDRLPPAGQLAALRAAGRGQSAHAKLLYGIALQRLGKPVSAERQFAAAAARTPNDPEALTAAAVGRFSKAEPAQAFSRLGPLAERFPSAQTVRFHLGLLLVYLRQVGAAKRQFQLALADAPGTTLGRAAKIFLAQLGTIRTG
jgi:tetratricopeptide (TPR) repeat protein